MKTEHKKKPRRRKGISNSGLRKIEKWTSQMRRGE